MCDKQVYVIQPTYILSLTHNRRVISGPRHPRSSVNGIVLVSDRLNGCIGRNPDICLTLCDSEENLVFTLITLIQVLFTPLLSNFQPLLLWNCSYRSCNALASDIFESLDPTLRIDNTLSVINSVRDRKPNSFRTSETI